MDPAAATLIVAAAMSLIIKIDDFLLYAYAGQLDSLEQPLQYRNLECPALCQCALVQRISERLIPCVYRFVHAERMKAATPDVCNFAEDRHAFGIEVAEMIKLHPALGE